MKPRTPDEFIGIANRIAHVLFKSIQHLKQSPDSDVLDRCWLFSGCAGVGKTSLANALALEACADRFSIESVNGQSVNIELVRQWQESGRYIPLSGLRVQIVNEIDAASPAAMNEARTYLDELPSHTLFLATTNKTPEELQPQLQSRFQIWRFQPVEAPAITRLLVSRFAVSEEIASGFAIGCGGNVRAAILDTKAFARTLSV